MTKKAQQSKGKGTTDLMRGKDVLDKNQQSDKCTVTSVDLNDASLFPLLGGPKTSKPADANEKNLGAWAQRPKIPSKENGSTGMKSNGAASTAGTPLSGSVRRTSVNDLASTGMANGSDTSKSAPVGPSSADGTTGFSSSATPSRPPKQDATSASAKPSFQWKDTGTVLKEGDAVSEDAASRDSLQIPEKLNMASKDRITSSSEESSEEKSGGKGAILKGQEKGNLPNAHLSERSISSTSEHEGVSSKSSVSECDWNVPAGTSVVERAESSSSSVGKAERSSEKGSAANVKGGKEKGKGNDKGKSAMSAKDSDGFCIVENETMHILRPNPQQQSHLPTPDSTPKCKIRGRRMPEVDDADKPETATLVDAINLMRNLPADGNISGTPIAGTTTTITNGNTTSNNIVSKLDIPPSPRPNMKKQPPKLVLLKKETTETEREKQREEKEERDKLKKEEAKRKEQENSLLNNAQTLEEREALYEKYRKEMLGDTFMKNVDIDKEYHRMLNIKKLPKTPSNAKQKNDTEEDDDSKKEADESNLALTSTSQNLIQTSSQKDKSALKSGCTTPSQNQPGNTNCQTHLESGESQTNDLTDGKTTSASPKKKSKAKTKAEPKGKAKAKVKSDLKSSGSTKPTQSQENGATLKTGTSSSDADVSRPNSSNTNDSWQASQQKWNTNGTARFNTRGAPNTSGGMQNMKGKGNSQTGKGNRNGKSQTGMGNCNIWNENTWIDQQQQSWSDEQSWNQDMNSENKNWNINQSSWNDQNGATQSWMDQNGANQSWNVQQNQLWNDQQQSWNAEDEDWHSGITWSRATWRASPQQQQQQFDDRWGENQQDQMGGQQQPNQQNYFDQSRNQQNYFIGGTPLGNNLNNALPNTPLQTVLKNKTASLLQNTCTISTQDNTNGPNNGLQQSGGGNSGLLVDNSSGLYLNGGSDGLANNGSVVNNGQNFLGLDAIQSAKLQILAAITNKPIAEMTANEMKNGLAVLNSNPALVQKCIYVLVSQQQNLQAHGNILHSLQGIANILQQGNMQQQNDVLNALNVQQQGNGNSFQQLQGKALLERALQNQQNQQLLNAIQNANNMQNIQQNHGRMQNQSILTQQQNVQGSGMQTTNYNAQNNSSSYYSGQNNNGGQNNSGTSKVSTCNDESSRTSSTPLSHTISVVGQGTNPKRNGNQNNGGQIGGNRNFPDGHNYFQDSQNGRPGQNGKPGSNNNTGGQNGKPGSNNNTGGQNGKPGSNNNTGGQNGKPGSNNNTGGQNGKLGKNGSSQTGNNKNSKPNKQKKGRNPGLNPSSQGNSNSNIVSDMGVAEWSANQHSKNQGKPPITSAN